MKLSQIVVPIITPFDEAGRIYVLGMQKMLSFLHQKGIRSIWILGSYGSFPLMTNRDRKFAVEIALAEAKKLGMTTIVQIGSPSTEIALDLARHAESNGADALATVVPFYYVTAHFTEDNIVYYFESVLKSTSLPVFYYNNPKTTGYTPTIDFLKRLLEIGVAGIKDTTSDFNSISEKIRLFNEMRPDGHYLGGSSSVFLPATLMGAKGVVCGTAVALPEIVMEIADAIANADIEKAVALQHVIHQIRSIQGRYVGRSLACYDLLNARGVDVGTCKSPSLLMTKTQSKDVLSKLKALGVLGNE